jgi:hypothetical protein
MGKFVPSGCDLLQYADDIVCVIVTQRISDCLCLGSDGLLVTQRFFFVAWTHDILYNVRGGMVFSEALAASGLDPDWRQIVVGFKYLGVFFDAGLRCGTQARRG